MRSPTNIYPQFIEFEEQASEVYLRLASRFGSENPELSALWLDMGLQEKQHAELLLFCLRERRFAPNLPTESEIRKVRALFTDLRERAGNPKLTVREAFEIAVEMETCEVNATYSCLTAPLHDSMYLLKRKIATSMPDHRKRLLTEGRKFGVPAETLRKLVIVRQALA